MHQPLLQHNQLLGINPGVRIAQDQFLARTWELKKRIIQRPPVAHTVGKAVVQTFLVTGPLPDVWCPGGAFKELVVRVPPSASMNA